MMSDEQEACGRLDASQGEGEEPFRGQKTGALQKRWPSRGYRIKTRG